MASNCSSTAARLKSEPCATMDQRTLLLVPGDPRHHVRFSRFPLGLLRVSILARAGGRLALLVILTDLIFRLFGSPLRPRFQADQTRR